MRQLFALAIAVLTAGLASACGSDGEEVDPTALPQGVVLASISPSSGPLGVEVVLSGSGFTAENNDVGFVHPEIDFQGQHTGYLNGLSSPDGTTLRFSLPDNDNVLLGACAFSQLGPDEACEAIGLLLPAGGSAIFVVNENGTSNSVFFTVTESPTAQPSP